jgi:hypothetical protein
MFLLIGTLNENIILELILLWSGPKANNAHLSNTIISLTPQILYQEQAALWVSLSLVFKTNMLCCIIVSGYHLYAEYTLWTYNRIIFWKSKDTIPRA